MKSRAKTKKCKNIYILVLAYNGSLTSSLASPNLAKPLNTFEEIAKECSSLNILLNNNSFQMEFMKNSGNKNLQTIYERSKNTGSKWFKSF
jgi:hypothetical protein